MSTKSKPKTYRCDVCAPPCVVKVKKHAVLLEPPERWFERPSDLKAWCDQGKLVPAKRGRPKKN